MHNATLARSALSQTLRQNIRPLSLRSARTLHSTALRSNRSSSSSSSSHTHPFAFLPANALEPKATRSKGLTEIRGPYYAPVTKTYLDELLQDWGEYVDGVKFAGGAFSLMPEDRLRALIDTAHSHGCYVSTGGFIERVLSASGGNKSVISKYLTACKNLGFDVLELSSGFLSIPTDDWASLIEFTSAHGLKPKPEVGIQWGAGGDASVEELESAGTRDPKWLIDRAKTFLDAGAYMIMIESEGITENVKNWRTDVISAVTSALPADKIMFEAADPDVFAYHIQNQGARANLFIDHSQVVQLACLRRGIWGTGSTFARVVTFEGAGEHFRKGGRAVHTEPSEEY
ncbi:coma-domain-containing protein [Trametes elegans]|nr:coma-domain-containing protein [Trametes elegans]